MHIQTAGEKYDSEFAVVEQTAHPFPVGNSGFYFLLKVWYIKTIPCKRAHYRADTHSPFTTHFLSFLSVQSIVSQRFCPGTRLRNMTALCVETTGRVGRKSSLHVLSRSLHEEERVYSLVFNLHCLWTISYLESVSVETRKQKWQTSSHFNLGDEVFYKRVIANYSSGTASLQTTRHFGR